MTGLWKRKKQLTRDDTNDTKQSELWDPTGWYKAVTIQIQQSSKHCKELLTRGPREMLLFGVQLKWKSTVYVPYLYSKFKHTAQAGKLRSLSHCVYNCRRCVGAVDPSGKIKNRKYILCTFYYIWIFFVWLYIILLLSLDGGGVLSPWNVLDLSSKFYQE